MAQANPFEVHALVYGGIVGPLIDTHATIEEAEAAHADGDPGMVLIVLGPGPERQQDQKAVCSERDSSGRWKRLTLDRPPST